MGSMPRGMKRPWSGPIHPVRGNRFGLAFEREWLHRRAFKQPSNMIVGAAANEYRIGRRLLFETRGGVHGVANHAKVLTRLCSSPQEHNPRVDTDPHVHGNVLLPQHLITQFTNAIHHDEGRANCVCGSVFAVLANAKDRHHRIADVLLHVAAESLDSLRAPGEIGRHDIPDILGIHGARERSEPDEVSEENGDQGSSFDLLPRFGCKSSDDRGDHGVHHLVAQEWALGFKGVDRSRKPADVIRVSAFRCHGYPASLSSVDEIRGTLHAASSKHHQPGQTRQDAIALNGAAPAQGRETRVPCSVQERPLGSTQPIRPYSAPLSSPGRVVTRIEV